MLNLPISYIYLSADNTIESAVNKNRFSKRVCVVSHFFFIMLMYYITDGIIGSYQKRKN